MTAPVLATNPGLLRVETKVPDDYPMLIRRRSFFGGSHYFSHELREAVLVPGVGDETLTDLGRILKLASTGRNFIDLGCGNPDKAPVPRHIAKLFGCRSYVGVDEENVEDRNFSERLEGGRNFQSHFLRTDILDFLSQYPAFGAVFYLSGLEPINLPTRKDLSERVSKPQINRDYIAAVLKEILRISRESGLLLLGAVTSAFKPEENDFDLVAQEKNHRLYAVKNRGGEFTARG